MNILINEINRRMALLGWNSKDLAIATGYRQNTVEDFLSSPVHGNKTVKECICRTLQIIQ